MDFVKQLTIYEGHQRSLDDKLKYFKALLSYPYWNRACKLIIYTRHYEQGFLFVEHMMKLLNSFKNRLSAAEYEEFDINLIFLYLDIMDKSDRWMRYVEYFNEVRIEKPYSVTYSISEPPERFGDFLLRSNEEGHHVHFLISIRPRYEVIKKKIERLKNGAQVNYLKHHPQSELSDEEIARRFDHILLLKDQRYF